MQPSNITGVRYIGAKEQKTDNVCGTDAVWKPKQVLNFPSHLAALLIVHAGVFELADVSPKAPTYMGNGKKVDGRTDQEPVAHANLTAMDEKQLDAYSRVNFNKSLDLKKPLVDLRHEVLGYMTGKNIDDEADRKRAEAASQGKLTVEFEVTEQELEAINNNVLKLALIPVEQEPEEPAQTDNDFSDGTKEDLTPVTQSNAAPAASGSVTNLEGTRTPDQETINRVDGTGTTTETAKTETAPAAPAADQTLPELLAQLDKEGLLKLAKQYKVKGINSKQSEEFIRNKLLSDLPSESK